MKTKGVKRNYHVYVVELSKRVFTENKKFREANFNWNGVQCCLYVGMTSQSPEVRFEKHKSGYRTKKGHKISSKFVEKYGLYLRPSLYSKLNPLTKADAIRLEEELANSLKKRGYAVWWN